MTAEGVSVSVVRRIFTRPLKEVRAVRCQTLLPGR